MPYVPETEISRICRLLPEGVQKIGNKEIRTFMPCYGVINERRHQLHEVIRLSGANIAIDNEDHPLLIKVASLQGSRLQVYFIANDVFFDGKEILYNPDGSDIGETDKRAIFFSRGVLETARRLRWEPKLIHINGWLSAFVPVYLRYLLKDDINFKNSKIVVSVYEDQFHQEWKGINKKLIVEGIEKGPVKKLQVTDYPSLMKMAIDLSDGVIIGSANILPELKEYIENCGKPYLPYHEEEGLPEVVNTFYDQILAL